MKKLIQQLNKPKVSFRRTLRELTILTLLFAVTLSTVSPAVTFASDQEFYAGNDILTYDRDAIACPIDSESIGTAGIQEITKEQKIAQTFIVGFSPTDTDTMRAIVTKYKIGGLFPVGGAADRSDNGGLTKAFFEELNTAAGAKLFIAADDEGGQVARFTHNITPSAAVMGRLTPAEAEAKGQEAGGILAARGLNGDLAPVLDVATPGTPWTASQRDWSSDHNIITSTAGAFAKGLKNAGVTPVYKHFPGIGGVFENTDEKKSTPQKLSDLTDDLMPFKALVNQNSGAVMMSNGYIEDWGDIPVGINKDAVEYLRQEIGFRGTIMTDALNALSMDGYGNSKMDLSTAIVAALNAGVDMPLFIPSSSGADGAIDAAIKAVASGVSEARIDTAYAKSLALRGLTAPAARPVDAANSATSCCMTESSDGVRVTLNGADNIEKTLSFFMAKGLTLAQAAGFIGNMQQESGVNPKAVQPSTTTDDPNYKPVSGTGFGLVQWTFPERQDPLVEHMKQYGSMLDLGGQLEYVWKELQSDQFNVGFKLLQTESSPVEAAITIHGRKGSNIRSSDPKYRGYEESGDSAEAVRSVRGGFAQEIYDKYKDNPALAGSAAPTPGTGTGVQGTGAVIAIDPGHGGEVGQYIDDKTKLADRETTNSPEREDAQEVAATVKTELEKLGYTVVLLRQSPTEAISKRDRVTKAAEAKANLAISIHTAPAPPGGSFDQVWPQRVGTYREYNGNRAAITNGDVASKSQAYADVIAKAREAAEGHAISLDPDNSSQAGSFSDASRTPSTGNASIIQIFGQDIPWVYNEITQDQGTALSADMKAKYAKGLIEGIKAAIPATGTGKADANCKGADRPAGATGNKIADTALSLAWPNKGQHDGTAKSNARESYQVAMPKYNLQEGIDEWTDCGVFTATVIRASGADPNYPGRGTAGAQHPYVRGNTTFQSFIPTDTSELAPGDVAVLDGHTYIYTGPYKGDDGKDYDIAQASLHDHPPDAGTVYLSDNRGPYTFGRLK